MRAKSSPLVFIEGLDGVGKSTTAQQVARNLNQAYPSSRIHVTDSTGLYAFEHGELTAHRFGRLSDLEPRQGMFPLNSVLRLGSFTLGRRFIDGQVNGSDLHISVRDPHRIEPAAYSVAYGLPFVGNLPAQRRLTLVDMLTRTPYADSIVHLRAAPKRIRQTAMLRGNATTNPHEAPEKLQIVADELPIIIGAYQRLFGANVDEVEGLTPQTSDEVTAAVEPFLNTTVTIIPLAS